MLVLLLPPLGLVEYSQDSITKKFTLDQLADDCVQMGAFFIVDVKH